MSERGQRASRHRSRLKCGGYRVRELNPHAGLVPVEEEHLKTRCQSMHVARSSKNPLPRLNLTALLPALQLFGKAPEPRVRALDSLPAANFLVEARCRRREESG